MGVVLKNGLRKICGKKLLEGKLYFLDPLL